MSEKRDASTSPLRGEVALEAREGVGSASFQNEAPSPHPGARQLFSTMFRPFHGYE